MRDEVEMSGRVARGCRGPLVRPRPGARAGPAGLVAPVRARPGLAGPALVLAGPALVLAGQRRDPAPALVRARPGLAGARAGRGAVQGQGAGRGSDQGRR